MKRNLLRALAVALLGWPLTAGCSGDVTTDGSAAGAGAKPGGSFGTTVTCSGVECVIQRWCGICPGDLDDCENKQRRHYEESVAESCGEEWIALTECVSAQRKGCGAFYANPCLKVEADWNTCMPAYYDGDGGPYAAQGPCHGAYTSKTLNWTVDCELNGVAFDCVCSSGPKSGTTFQLNNCSMGWTKVAEPHCR